jgi:glutathione peroxidase
MPCRRIRCLQLIQLRALIALRYAACDLFRRVSSAKEIQMKALRNRVRPFVALGLVMMMAGSAFAASNIYDFTLPSIDGKPMPLADFKGKVVLLVNVASRCGYTPQYSALEALYEKYKDKGFVIVGFPANNFAGQEPGTNEEIKTFCSRKYNVTFPLYSKVSVKGEDQTPLYQYLTKQIDPSVAGEIKWNFTKFLVDRDGHVVQRFEPAVTPDSKEVISAVEKQLSQK